MKWDEIVGQDNDVVAENFQRTRINGYWNTFNNIEVGELFFVAQDMGIERFMEKVDDRSARLVASVGKNETIELGSIVRVPCRMVILTENDPGEPVQPIVH